MAAQGASSRPGKQRVGGSIRSRNLAFQRRARNRRSSAYLAKEIGRPVRVQWMRNEETWWDTKGPAFTFKIRGGLDASGNLVALDYSARAADFYHLGYNEAETPWSTEEAG